MKITWKVWLLFFVLLLAAVSIRPSFKEGVLVTSVDENSSALRAGLKSGEIIKILNSERIKSLSDYTETVKQLPNKTEKLTIKTEKNEYIFLSAGPPEITVSEIPKSRLKAGLDLRGGSRALVEPERQLSSQEMSDLLSVTENRLNTYGIADIRVRSVSDLSGNKFMLVEVAGATKQDLRNLIAKQGKFEARIGNETAFIGGEKDITSVCRNDPKCAGIRECFPSGGGTFCKFEFAISLSSEAAERHASITEGLSVNVTEGRYLSKHLDLYLDDKLVDSLRIAEELKGKVTTQISVSGGSFAPTQDEAIERSQESMKRLQTILITGSLPFKLKIIKLDTISSLLGSQLIKNILLVAAAAAAGVFIFVFLRYRKFNICFPMFFTMLSEIVIILGVAAAINWNLDLASIAGIIAAVGTGIDDQIIILDESRLGRIYSWKERLRRAFFIILGAYATTFVAMLPLAWAGAGLLKGFAITTIIGISVGVFITRPAFADMIEKIQQ